MSAAARSGGNAARVAGLVARTRELGIVVALLLLVATTSAIQPNFLRIGNIQFVLLDTTLLALLALGETMVVVSRNVDLSIGSVLGLSAYLSSSLFGHFHGINVALVFLCGLGIGLVCGAVNGAVVSIGRVPSLVVTLATLYIIRGLDILIVGGGQVVASSLPNSFRSIGTATVLDLPDLAVVTALVVAVGTYYLHAFRSGRDLYALGSNPDAARLAGVPIGRRVFTAFVCSGAIAGVAGVLWGVRYGTIDSTAGTGIELQVIASVVIGGVAIFGGSGSAAGAALGALLLSSIASSLQVLGISPFWVQAIAGFLLICAIAVDRAITVRLTAALRRRGPHARA